MIKAGKDAAFGRPNGELKIGLGGNSRGRYALCKVAFL